MIVEVVQGEGGVIPADLDWLRGLRRITEQAGVALIVDEIQSGFGRTGKMFAFEHAGIIPDVVVMSKAVRCVRVAICWSTAVFPCPPTLIVVNDGKSPLAMLVNT